jgi:CRP-like cAMP-binding protein
MMMRRRTTRDRKQEMLASALPALASDGDGLAAAGRLTDIVEVPAGHALIEEDVPGTEIFVLAHGAVDLVRHGRVQATLIPNASFGEHNLFDLGAGGAVARNHSELIVIDRRAFKSLMKDAPGIALHVLESLARRLDSAEAALASANASCSRRLPSPAAGPEI